MKITTKVMVVMFVEVFNLNPMDVPGVGGTSSVDLALINKVL